MRIPSLGWEDSLEEEMATHSSILVWRIPRTEEPGRLQSTRSQIVRTDSAAEHTQLQPETMWCMGRDLIFTQLMDFPPHFGGFFVCWLCLTRNSF